MTNTATNLKKGLEVYLLESWDNKGTVRVTRWIVRSAGAKQVHLTKADGSNLEQRLHTELLAHPMTCLSPTIVVAISETPDVEAKALELAAQTISRERERFERACARTDVSEGYRAAIRADLAKLHEPRVLHA